MTQPSYVPITEADQVRGAYRLRTPLPWRADRVADLRTPGQPRGREMGVPGPDQGYALFLAERLFRERLELTPGVTAADALTGATEVASARAALFGRAPVAGDVEMALQLFGFLGDAPAELVTWRDRLFQAASHHYEQRRRIVDAVPVTTLRMTTEKVRARLSDWQALVSADTTGTGSRASDSA
ncbi:MAG TPA: hypothetical protein VK386_04695 [Acidimicrobiales bacterium]|nr:hypothetical protein [Acidimicrobiales bacterium]